MSKNMIANEIYNQALKSSMEGHKYGAALVYKGKIISAGYNYYLFRCQSQHPLGLCIQ